MSSTASAMSSHLYFPPEVWSLTLQKLRSWKSQDELTYAWTTVRHVCRQFKEEVEEIFRTEHVPKTWLHLDTRELLTAKSYLAGHAILPSPR